MNFARHFAAILITTGALSPAAVFAQVAPPPKPATQPPPPSTTPTQPPPSLTDGKGNPLLAPRGPATAPAPGTPGVDQPVQIQQSTEQAVKFDPAVLDLGELIPEVATTRSVNVTNVTDHPVKIIRIQPACGCTTTSAPPGPLQPGETTKVDITLRAPAHGGPVSKSVSFMFEGHVPQPLTIQGIVKEYITVTPTVVDGPEGPEAVSTPVRLSSKDENLVKVTGSQPDIFVSIPSEAAKTHDLFIDWNKWRKAGTPSKVAILTDHPKAAQASFVIKRPLTAPRGTDPSLAPTAAQQPAAQFPPVVVWARDGNVEKLTEALKSGADVEAQESTARKTALHMAAENGNVEIVKLLLDAKANPNAVDRTARTPVSIAAQGGKAEALKLLLAAGGDMERRDATGGTPLFWAAGLGDVKTVTVLLDAGANINIVTNDGITPLSFAANIGKPEVVRLLADRGADVKVQDSNGMDTALIRAIRNGHVDSVKVLLEKHSDLNARTSSGMTPFLVACASGDLAKIQLLIDAGADKTAKDRRGWGAIDFARNRLDPKRADVIKFLEPIVPASTAAAPPQTKEPEATPPAKS